MAQFFMKMAEAVKKNTLKPGGSIPGCNSYFLCKYLKDTMLQARFVPFTLQRDPEKIVLDAGTRTTFFGGLHWRPCTVYGVCACFFLVSSIATLRLLVHLRAPGRTYLFCAIRPEVAYHKYTFSTLGFAKNASVVKLKPKLATVRATPAERKLMEELEQMKVPIVTKNKAEPDGRAPRGHSSGESC